MDRKNRHKRVSELYFQIIMFVLFVMMATVASASQPEWCSVEYFKSHELPTNAPNTKRLRSFKIGKLELSGLALGNDTNANEVRTLAPLHSKYSKYCTWYLNKGNKDSEKFFHHEYMRGPYWGWLDWLVDITGVVKSYEKRLERHWEPMVSCAEQYGYVAMGCNGHRHRGPSVFASLLGLSGCDPDTATDIANYLWSLNGVPDHTRERIAKIGYQLGNEKPELRRRLQKVMSGK